MYSRKRHGVVERWPTPMFPAPASKLCRNVAPSRVVAKNERNEAASRKPEERRDKTCSTVRTTPRLRVFRHPVVSYDVHR